MSAESDTIKNTVRSLTKLRGLCSASSLTNQRRIDTGKAPARWSLQELSGRLVELTSPPNSASSVLTISLGLVAEAQRSQEPACWVTVTSDTFFPPDAERTGVDLSLLPIIRIWEEDNKIPQRLKTNRRHQKTNARKTFSPLNKALRAVELLIRSGAFGLVVMDLGKWRHLPPYCLSRLKGLVRKHATALVFLTQKCSENSSSLGSLISLQGMARRRRIFHSQCSPALSNNFCECVMKCVKDKRHGPSWENVEICSPSPGLK